MSNLIDLTNQSFGYWQVIKRGENSPSGRARWVCKCLNCNNIKEVDGAHLRSGRSTNCGCIRLKNLKASTIKNEKNKIYGFLYVNRMATQEEKPRKDKTGIYWNCSCLKCGRKNVIVFGDYLRNGDTKSCGCLISFNESKICQILDNENIKYQTQKSFNNLKSIHTLFFDIAVYEDTLLYLIEYDGIQHFEEKHFKNAYSKTHKNDLIKNKYCFENNIPLIRIPYDAEYNIDDLKLETTRFLLTPENEEEYYSSRRKEIE